MLGSNPYWVARAWAFALSAFLGTTRITAAEIDLSKATIVNAPSAPKPVQKAAQMLRDEMARRTHMRLSRTNAVAADQPMIALGSLAELHRMFSNVAMPAEIGRGAPEGFSIFLRTNGAAPLVCIVGNEPRGVVFGAGRLLRELRMLRERILLTADLEIHAAPQMPLRGHQLGYRPKTNSYDAWDVEEWEQYIRDLVVFGCNSIELIPPRSDDDEDSPHFPLPQMDMMIEMSRLAHDYGLDVWLWYPAMDKDYADAATVGFALREWAGVFSKLPRVDAVFVPGGDPGHTQPKHLFALLERQTTNLHQFHPRAQMWVSPQSFIKPWMDEFLELMRAEPAWLTGIVHGPQVRMPVGELRAAIPSRYPIRDYPDITHSRHCQYPVPGWDLAFVYTEGREGINPRPTQMAQIFRVTTLPHTRGFITYSEGCNDDVNKAVWSALGWDPNSDVRQILGEYSRYFIGPARETDFAEGLLALEQNWNGAVRTNASIAPTFEKFRAMEKSATPQEKQNWRFQQALYRAYYDEYVRRRLTNEFALEEQAMTALGKCIGTDKTGSLEALRQAEEILDRATNQPVALDIRARLFELAEALFQSIRMQLSTELYAGMRGRGDNLDDIDAPLNNRVWLKHRFGEIRRLATEEERRNALAEIVNWTDPGPGGFYDDLGNPERQPHLVRGIGWEKDPGFYATPQVGFADRMFNNAPLPRRWWTAAECLYDSRIQMRYDALDRSARYKFCVVYGRYKNSAPVQLLADGLEVHPRLQRECERLEFDVPPAATADGELTLTFQPETGRGGNGRVLEVAEVWLMKH